MRRRRRRRSGGRLNYDDYLGETQLNFSQINECNLIRIGSNYPATLLYKDELMVNRGTGKKLSQVIALALCILVVQAID